MTTTDNVLLIILTSLLSLYFLLGIILLVLVIKTMHSVKRVVGKAEHVVDNAESVAEVLKDTSGKLAFFKILHNIINLVNRRDK